MEFTRNLKRYKIGEDVKAVKDKLLELGYLTKSTHSMYGNDTYNAVKRYQENHGLEIDGIVGRMTWNSLFGEQKKEEQKEEPKEEPKVESDIVIPHNISVAIAEKLKVEIAGVSATRRKIVLKALECAYDQNCPAKYPYSLYIRGGNLYNKDLTLNKITASKIESGSKTYPEYYKGGSKQMMLNAVAYNTVTSGADCSGGVVGLMRYAKVVSASFDASANSLCSGSHSKQIDKSQLTPGDWVGLDGHIGLYVGAGYVVEWYGQNFGCQLTGISAKRKAYDFVNKKYSTRSVWTKYRRPKYY